MTGSSPHVRGALGLADARVVEVGIIPACAGSTRCHGGGQASFWDHPRMCGEHLDGESVPVSSKGSSPHVRGALVIVFTFRVDEGIIPACAGSTRPRRGEREDARDHPRMCGEHEADEDAETAETGSSPHVRGAPVLVS